MARCLDALDQDELRRHNALETLYVVVAAVLHHRFSNWASDVGVIICGKEPGAVDTVLARFFAQIGAMLFVDSEDIRRLAINLFITLLTANNSLEDNFIVSHVLKAGLERKILELTLSQPDGVTRRDCLTIITLLAIHRELNVALDQVDGHSEAGEAKFGKNPYSQILRECESGPFLKHTIMLLEHDMRVALRHRGGVPYEERVATTGSNFTSVLGAWWRLGTNSTVVHLIDEVELNRALSSPTECFLSHPGLSFLVLNLLARHNDFFLKSLFFPSTIDMPSNNASRKLPTSTVPQLLCDFLEISSFFLPSIEPKGLVYSRIILTTLLVIVENTEICFLLHDDKVTARLFFSGEKQKFQRSEILNAPLPLACAIIEACHIFLRNHLSGDSLFGGELPWICELYSTCLQVLHRLVCFQKKMHMRISYPWKTLWGTLMTFLTNFCAAILARKVIPADSLYDDVLPVIHHVLILFNIGITFGDSFLPSPSDYDELYYEIIRCEREWKSIISSTEEIIARINYDPNSLSSSEEVPHEGHDNENGKDGLKEGEIRGEINLEITKIMEKVSEISPKGKINSTVPQNGHSSPENGVEEKKNDSNARESKYNCAYISSDLFNLNSILTHFSEKLGHFSVANPDTPLSGPLVINMIKSNYENLRLLLQDDIDQFEKYDPSKTPERKLLRRYAKVLVQDLKLKRYTEIEAAIAQPVSSKIIVNTPS